MTREERRLRRLLAVRRIGEELERRHLRHVLASAAEAETAIAFQKETIAGAAEGSASALQRGDRGDWLLCEAQSEVAGWNSTRLAQVLEARQTQVGPATCSFLERRREREQVQELIGSARRRERSAEDRRAQAAADDWFLAERVRKRR